MDLHSNQEIKMRITKLFILLAVLIALPVFAQAPPPYQGGPPSQGQPPSYPPAQLDQLVSRIALYPDPLVGQILAAATYPG